MKKTQSAPHFFTVDSFYEKADSLRSEFEQNFANPLESHNKRFVWDFWNVPDQYSLIRTPAYYYFTEKLYNHFHTALLEFGRQHLGCYNVTPPWMSYYVDGCYQQLHADVPHGPWAFVFSLSPTDILKYTGGETLMLKPQVLNYWQNFDSFKGVEQKDLVDKIPALFNRLTVFDPRVPHGVTEVHGTRDPREARLVIHGWFTDPEPYVVGPLTRKQSTKSINEFLERIGPFFEEFADIHGTLSWRFQVSPQGEVLQDELMTNTLLSLAEVGTKRTQILIKKMRAELKKTKFPKSKDLNTITLPILFRF